MINGIFNTRLGQFARCGIVGMLKKLLCYLHLLVQAAAIVGVAGILYFLFRHFVFSQPSPVVLSLL